MINGYGIMEHFPIPLMYTYLGNWDHGIMLGIPLFEQESILLDFTGLGI